MTVECNVATIMVSEQRVFSIIMLLLIMIMAMMVVVVVVVVADERQKKVQVRMDKIEED